MHSVQITPVILCGGSGTRLWPLSRKSFPKQFVPLICNKSLLQLTLERLRQLTATQADPSLLCVASEAHRFLVDDALGRAGMGATVILESTPRNTAAAMALAAIQAKPDDLLLFCPSDHHVPDHNKFAITVNGGVQAALKGAIVTFGVVPAFPSTAYGYIRPGVILPEGGSQVQQFVEKPNKGDAQVLILEHSALWNAGIFLAKASTVIDALSRHAPDILACCQQAMSGAELDGHFVRPDHQAMESCRAESIDYAVMEHEQNAVVVPFDGSWSDVGSWNAVAELCEPDENGNRIEGQGIAIDAANTYIHAPARLVVALGTQDMLIVDTPDALLVAADTHGEKVRDVVSVLARQQHSLATTHRKVARPWGSYDCVDMGERFQVKRITVRPGAALSLQKHYHRAEHWVVVKGVAQVTRGEETFLLEENQSTYIPIGQVHRLANPGSTELEMIEIQTGSYLGEDDIVRLEDTYGRV